MSGEVERDVRQQAEVRRVQEVQEVARAAREQAEAERAVAEDARAERFAGTRSARVAAPVEQVASDPSAAHQRSYQAGAETPGILQELRAAFGLSTDSAVIRRALALARVIARAAQGTDSILIRKKDGTEQVIILRG